jgi:sarcosine oxidase delta subunit
MDYVFRFEWKDTGTDEWAWYEQRGDKAFFERIRDTKAPEIYAMCLDCLPGKQHIDTRHLGLYFEPTKQQGE